jgi:hypothetical protein
MQGIGASLSNLVSGLIVVMAGYSAALLALAGVSLASFTMRTQLRASVDWQFEAASIREFSLLRHFR